MLALDPSTATAQELLDHRGDPCAECKRHDCDAIPCDRCGKHAFHAVARGEGDIAILCPRCVEERCCDSCGVKLPRWRLANIEGDCFCAKCVGYEPEANW